jgi:hypothetical protein
MQADVVAAADGPPEIASDVALLVVGDPNHAFGMPRPSTREGAVQQYGADIPDTSVRPLVRPWCTWFRRG